MTDKELLIKRLELINRQQAEIDDLTERLNATIAGQESLQKALAEKDREIERLTTEKDQLIKTFGECQAEAAKEILKNEKEIERLNNNISAMAITMHNCAKATRAEAIRAFVKRLKRECLIDRGYEILHEGTIDNLVKEMAGEG